MDKRGVVVGYDGSPGSDGAVEWAAGWARRQHLPLTVLYSSDLAAVPVAPAYSVGQLPTVLADASQAIVDRGVERAATVLDRAQVRGEATVGSPVAELVLASEDAAFVVTGSRARGRVAAGLLGSVSYAVTAHARCPAVVVRGEPPSYPDADHKVLVGVDDSEESLRALDVAAQIAADAGARLHIVRVGHLRSPEGWAYVESTAAGTDHSHAVRAESEESAAHAAERVRRSHPDLVVEAEALYGDAGHVLSPLTSGAGMIVVGSRGRGGFAGLLLGSVSHTVIREAECPVLVVR